ncbi:hypothetical protein QL285_010666 [Trifolium repens]|jgi:hypothetical protein|nr:hypothetical protein QL285_010666 [Trifolium repens]
MIGFKDVSMLSWNIWGALNKTAQRHLMDIIRRHSPTFLIIMETHGVFEKTISFWNKAGYSKIAIAEARGQAGGLWILKQTCSNVVTTVEDSFHDTITIKVAVGNEALTRSGPRPFRFEAVWITHPNYQNVVQSAWSKQTPCPIAGLNQVQTDSHDFNRNVFGNIRHQNHILERRIKGIQRSLEMFDSARLVYLEQDLQLQYDRILSQEEILWYQKSRDKWIKLGDKNTKFFHAATVIRRKRNKYTACISLMAFGVLTVTLYRMKLISFLRTSLERIRLRVSLIKLGKTWIFLNFLKKQVSV